MDTPLISIIIPTYNRADLLPEAVRSVIAQTFTDWELIVMDDSSTDNTEVIVDDFAQRDGRIRYFRHPKNVGIARNRNEGLAQAKGKLIAMLDSDDVWLDHDKLRMQAEYLASHPDCVLVGTFASVIDTEGRDIGTFEFATDDASIRAKMLARNQFVQSSLLYRKIPAMQVGGYDSSYTVADDYDLWLKMGSEGSLANIPRYATGYREHGGGITKTRRVLAAREHLAIIRRHKKAYPKYFFAFIKAQLRIMLAYIKK